MKFLEASISMNNKRMNESDISASVASSRLYSILQSRARSSSFESIDANAAIITTHLPPDTPSTEYRISSNSFRGNYSFQVLPAAATKRGRLLNEGGYY